MFSAAYLETWCSDSHRQNIHAIKRQEDLRLERLATEKSLTLMKQLTIAVTRHGCGISPSAANVLG